MWRRLLPDKFQSKATLSAGRYSEMLSDVFSIIGSDGVAKIINGKFYAGDPDDLKGYMTMSNDGLELYNDELQQKFMLGPDKGSDYWL